MGYRIIFPVRNIHRGHKVITFPIENHLRGYSRYIRVAYNKINPLMRGGNKKVTHT